ncbi:hypothetical protein pb186bvf_004864 [Paramecium bursaria]
MFSFEYIKVPQHPSRYTKVPTNVINQTINSSVEGQSDRKLKKLKPKEQLKKGPNFYHYTSIYNLKEYKNLANTLLYNKQDIQPSIKKLNDSQTKVLVADFQRKVAEYLLKSKEGSKNVKKYYSDIKVKASLKELDSQILQTNEDAVNKSLSSNKYNYRTEYQSDLGVEVLLMDNKGLITKQIITNEKIQMRLFKQMQRILDDDRVDYDEKMKIMVEQYEEVVKRISTQAFKIRLPDNYSINMSDYNEYYQISERKKIDYFQQKIDEVTDEILQSIQTSKASSFQKEPQIVKTQEDVPLVIPIQEIYKTQESDTDDPSQPKKQRQGKQREKKAVEPPQQPQRPNYQNSSRNVVQQTPSSRGPPQPQQPAEPEENEMEKKLREYLNEKNQAHHKKERSGQQSQQDHDEARRRRKEIDRLQKEIQRIKDEKHDFQYDPADLEERMKRQKQNENSNFEEYMFRRKSNIDAEPEQGDQSSRDAMSQTSKHDNKDMDLFIKDTIEEKQQLIKIQQQFPPGSPKGNQQQTVSFAKIPASGSAGNYTNNSSQSLHKMDSIEIKLQHRTQPSQGTIMPTAETTNDIQIQDTQKTISPNKISKDQQRKQNNSQQEQQNSFHSRYDSDQQSLPEDIQNKLHNIEENLIKAKLGIIDKLLESDNVYEVEIAEYKIADYDKELAEIPPQLVDQEDQSIFKELFAWQKEIARVIPRLRVVNRNVEEELNMITEQKEKDSDDDQSDSDK